jgi:hypothetical protein
MPDVLKNLVDGLSVVWVKVGKYWRVPCKSVITQARQRLGAGVMRQLFHQLVRPLATGETIGAFARVFGRPGSRPGTVAVFGCITCHWLVTCSNGLTLHPAGVEVFPKTDSHGLPNSV